MKPVLTVVLLFAALVSCSRPIELSQPKDSAQEEIPFGTGSMLWGFTCQNEKWKTFVDIREAQFKTSSTFPAQVSIDALDQDGIHWSHWIRGVQTEAKRDSGSVKSAWHMSFSKDGKDLRLSIVDEKTAAFSGLDKDESWNCIETHSFRVVHDDFPLKIDFDLVKVEMDSIIFQKAFEETYPQHDFYGVDLLFQDLELTEVAGGYFSSVSEKDRSMLADHIRKYGRCGFLRGFSGSEIAPKCLDGVRYDRILLPGIKLDAAQNDLSSSEYSNEGRTTGFLTMNPETYRNTLNQLKLRSYRPFIDVRNATQEDLKKAAAYLALFHTREEALAMLSDPQYLGRVPLDIFFLAHVQSSLYQFDWSEKDI